MKTVWLSALGVATLSLATAVIAATPTPEYIAKAGAGDLYETQSSRLVLQTTHNAQIRRFATMMISDHMRSTALVKAAAQRSNIHVGPPTLDPAQTQMISALTNSRGTARDRLYLEQQHQAHQQALTLHKDYAASGDNAALKAAAAQIVPVVERHMVRMPH